MKSNKTMKEYLSALYTAEAIVTDDPTSPLQFNGATTLNEYRIDLIDVELPVISLMMEIRQRALENNTTITVLFAMLSELESVFGKENGHATHRYLHVTWEGFPLAPEDLNAETRKRLDEYLRLQRASFLRQAKWLNNLPANVVFPCSLRGTDMDIAEIMALHLHSSLVAFPDDKYLIREFIYYFCHVWNLPPAKDYSTLISHALARPHPTAFLEKLVSELQNHIEQLDSKRK